MGVVPIANDPVVGVGSLKLFDLKLPFPRPLPPLPEEAEEDWCIGSGGNKKFTWGLGGA